MRLFLLTVLALLAFAANSVLNRAAVGGGGIGPEAFAFLRVCSGALVLLVLVRGRGVFERPSVWGVLGLSAYLIGFSQAYIGLDAGFGALILFGAVQASMFTGALCQGEVVPPRRWFGMLIAFAGLVLAMSAGFGEGSAEQLGIGFMVLAGIGWGVFSLVGQKVTDPSAATARSLLWSVPLVGLSTIGASYEADLWGVVLAVISGAITSGLGYLLWYSLLPALGASRAAVAQLTVPIIAMAGGMLFLAEDLTWLFVQSTLLVLGGVWFAIRKG